MSDEQRDMRSSGAGTEGCAASPKGHVHLRVIASATALLLLTPVSLTAETLPKLKPGDHLSIRMQDTREHCVLDSIDTDTLYVRRLKDNEPRQVVKSQVGTIHVRVPRSPGQGALRGALIGGGVGGVVGIVIAVANPEEEAEVCGEAEDVCQTTLTSLKALGYGGLLGMLGAGAGAIIGAAAPGTEWQAVDLRLAVSLSMDTERAVYLLYSRAF